ncbi:MULTISPECIES: CRISPR-associated endonuclease Cas2 [Rodentibacter]|uniref:CRISPR-associated endonuclease Cas2 n=1 Tax=Rodentibacter TaxID=1960084 RepID=UPI001CFE612C|nr:CRISPR-associated endonuclease Cas2 [Rodentibacter sp. JRC1]GJI56759.1 hypothetical protein HEMROJRC1_18710 [Rodentibacter sp. JRC1]
MPNRFHYLIAYDICDSKRLQKVHKIIESYAIGGQKSLYECWVTQHELATLKQNLTACIEPSDDRIYFFQLFENNERQFYGKAYTKSTQPFLFV